jgi:phage/plasmid-associated DNA primase
MNKVLVMEPSLWQFLTLFRDHTDHYNFTSQITPYVGKFRIERKELEVFWNKYCDAVSNDVNFISGLAERPNEHLPLLVDGDLEMLLKPGMDVNNLEKLYLLEEVIEVGRAYQKIIKEVVKNWNPKDCICFLLEKEKPYISGGSNVSGNKIKGGFHLHFPKLWIRNCDHDLHIYPRVVKYLNDNKKNLFSKLEVEETGDLIDKGVASKHWLLYGGSKSFTSGGTYKVTKLFDYNFNEITFDEGFNGYKLLDTHGEEIKLNNDNYKYYLPRILSIHPANQKISHVKAKLDYISEHVVVTAKERTLHHESVNIVEDIQIAKELINLISSKRIEDWDEWLEMGWILYNIGDGCVEALDLWTEFSSKTSLDNYDESSCIYQWKRMINTHKFSIGTLRHYASIDSPKEYEKWTKKKASSRIKDTLLGGHTDLAKMLHDRYANVFVCGSLSKNSWYEYKNHKWQFTEKGTTLRAKISDELVDRFELEINKLYRQVSSDDLDEDVAQKKIKQLKSIVGKLKTCTFKNNVLSECSELFYNKEFLSKLDNDANLLGFENGVLDLRTMTFRDGKPEDYIRKSTKYEYKEFTDDSPEVIEVKEFLFKVFTDQKLRRYFLEYCARILKGGNSEKTFLIMTGGEKGNNAKTITIDLIFLALGEYAIKFPTSLITGVRTQSSQACPELARSQGARFGAFQEPSPKDKINQGTFKELSGNDSFFARTIFDEGGEITPMFKLAMACFVGKTKITLSCGISVSLKNLAKSNQKVLAWNNKNSLINAKQTQFIDQGKKECVKLILTDGRKITCTPDHKFLTIKGEWIEAQNIELNKTAIKMGIEYSICNEIFMDVDYKFIVGSYIFDLKIQEDRFKAAAMCRIIGYMLTDGTLNTRLFIGHVVDVENIRNDIELLTDKRPAVQFDRCVYNMKIPSKLTKELEFIIPIQHGGRINNPMFLPKFIFDEKCPILLIKEFLGGLYGGDGCIPCLSKRKDTGNLRFHSSIKFVASKSDKYLESLIVIFKNLSKVLKNRFDIESFIDEPRAYGINCSTVQLIIGKQENVLKFIKSIGFRYCCHKSYRVTAMACYIRYKNHIINQNNFLINRSKQIVENWKYLPIIQLSKKGEEIAKYDSPFEAQQETRIDKSSIARVCRKQAITAGNYKWKWDKEASEDIIRKQSIKEAYEVAIEELFEEQGGLDKTYLLNYQGVRNYTNKDKESEKVTIDVEKFLDIIKLRDIFNLADGEGEKIYSVNRTEESLSLFQMFVTGRKNVGKKQVYDISIEEPYSSFLAEGAIVHNCNTLPRIETDEAATWDRVRILPFQSRFVKNSKDVAVTLKEQLEKKTFLQDPYFCEKLPNMKQAFMWILVQVYKEIKQGNIQPEPTKVMEATQLYRRNNDLIYQFICESIIIDHNSKCKMSLNEIYAFFKNWFADAHSTLKVQSKNEFKEELSRKFGPCSNDYIWQNVRLRTLNDDVAEAKALILNDNDLVNDVNDCEIDMNSILNLGNTENKNMEDIKVIFEDEDEEEKDMNSILNLGNTENKNMEDIKVIFEDEDEEEKDEGTYELIHSEEAKEQNYESDSDNDQSENEDIINENEDEDSSDEEYSTKSLKRLLPNKK